MLSRLRAYCVLFALSVFPLFSQTFGDISGEVRDSSGAAIPNARVVVINTDTNVSRETATNEAGAYSFPSLVPGPYRVRAEKEGFKSVTRTDLQLQVQQSARLDFEMTVGQVSESVEVSAQAQLLATEDATIGTVIENKRIVELPLNGRNYLQLVSLAPNVSYGFGSAGQAGSRQGGERASQNISVAGQRSYFNEFTLDGVENTDPNFNTYVIQPSIDALQEFKVQTGVYPAEFGREATQINVSTKPGTNQYHGTLFEFLRNDKLDAKNYAFTAKPVSKDPFKWNQYGFTFGGPVWIPKVFNGRNKLFFMTNYESFRQRRNTQAVYNLPSAAMREGNFSELIALRGAVIYDPATRVYSSDGKVASVQPFAGNIIPANRISATAKKFLEFYPTPNLVTGNLTSNFQQAQSQPRNKDQFIARMDFSESSNSQWFGRYSWGDENQLNQGLKLNGFQVLTNVEQYMGSNIRVFSPAVVNEFRFGYTRFFNSAGRELAFKRDVVTELAVPGLKGGDPVTWGIPAVAFDRYGGFGDDSEGPYANNNNAYQFVDNISWIRGKHAFRFGGEIRRDGYNQVGNQFARGSFTFQANATANPNVAGTGDDFADFLLGQVKRSEAAVAIATAQFRATSFAMYVDDVWKVSPRLTVNLGLRYENTPPWEDQSGRLITVGLPFMDSTPNVADLNRHPYFLRQGSGDFFEGLNITWPNVKVKRDGSLGNRLVARDNTNFAPRLGVTWNPTSKWVIRAGAGTFFSQDTGNPRFDMARNQAGRTRFEADINGSTLYTFDNAFASLAGAKAVVPTPYSFANVYDRRTPRTYQYLLNIQRELPGNTVLEFGYLGSISRHLESLRAVNEAIPGTTALLSRIPYPEFGRIQIVDNGANGNYNGLAAKVTKRYSGGLTALLSYTYSKSIDESSSIRTHDGDTLFPQNSYCLRCERALSIFNTKSRLVTSILYDLPFGKGRAHGINNRFANTLIGGWQVGGIITYQSGFPLTITNSKDTSGTGGGFDRPNATGIDPVLPRDQQTTARFFNTAAFAFPTAGTFGNVGRNTLIGPRIFSLDASALKDFHFTERQYLQFRWEAFNLPNHPNWGNPGTNINSTAFGTITGTRTNMRQMQFALKYVF